MRNACDSDSRCGLACDASARDAKSLAMWVERCEAHFALEAAKTLRMAFRVVHSCWFFLAVHIRGAKKTNKHKQLLGIVPEMDGGQIVYVFLFFLGKKRETHKQNSQEISEKGRDSPGIIPGQSRENFVYVFSSC